MSFINRIQPARRGGGGGQKVATLAMNVNNF